MIQDHNHPLGLDALARREDVPASEKVPEEVRVGLATARVRITVPSHAPMLDYEATPSGSRKKDGRNMVLPEGSFMGVAVGETKLHARGSLLVPATAPLRMNSRRFIFFVMGPSN